jgi:hypothetical protein
VQNHQSEGARGPNEAEEAGGGALPARSPDGVDLTLIRWMLGLTPRERLEFLQSTIVSILRLRDVRHGS